MARNFLGNEPGILIDGELNKATLITVESNQFAGNLASSDNTVQKCLQKFNDFIASGGGSGGPCNIDGGFSDTIYFALNIDGGGA